MAVAWWKKCKNIMGREIIRRKGMKIYILIIIIIIQFWVISFMAGRLNVYKAVISGNNETTKYLYSELKRAILEGETK